MTPNYNWPNIRILLSEGFTESELRRLCTDHPTFRKLRHDVANLHAKSEVVDSLVEFADTRLCVADLLAWAKNENPARFELHGPYASDEAPVRPDRFQADAMFPQPDMSEEIPRQPFEPEMITIPAGYFWMGTDRAKLEAAGIEWQDWMADETPYHRLQLPEYQIGKYPVTNTEYGHFIEAGGPEPNYWFDKKYNQSQQPVVGVNFHDALSYCQWLSEETGRNYTLPSEAEWEKAARGRYGRIWPWGNQWDEKRCNSHESGFRKPSPVGQFSPQGDSPYGLVDVAGNVWEWTRSRAIG